MDKVGDHIWNRVRSMGLGRQASAAAVCAAASEVAEGGFVPVSFRAGTLKIRVPSSAASYRVKMRQKEIIYKINAKLEADAVKSIRFEIGGGIADE